MKRLRRALFNLAAVVSLALWVLLLASWLWGLGHHAVIWRSVGHQLIFLRLYGPGPELIVVNGWQTAEPLRILSKYRAPGATVLVGPSEPNFAVPLSHRSSPRPVNLLVIPGMSIQKQPLTVFNLAPGGPIGDWIFTLPVHNTLWFGMSNWASLVYPSVLPALWLYLTLPRIWRTAWRKRRGLCIECGYDLRATPERCPECGEIPESQLVANKKKRCHPSIDRMAAESPQ